MAVLQSTLRLSLLDQVSAPVRKVSAALGSLQRQQMSAFSPMRSLAGQVLAFGGAYLGVTKGISSTAGAAISFESAFADVKKVVEATDEQFQNMQTTIRKMAAQDIPIAAADMAALFAAAGESGIAMEDLTTFSQMAARVGIAFDIGAGQAGESLAKLKTQLGLSLGETGDLADAINHLSNGMASKASEITEYMLRIGSLAEMAGFSATEIAGLGSAMIAAGAAPEIAGTAMQNVAKALTKGEFAKKGQREVAAALGLDLPTIAKQMQKDAPKALKTVLTAIGKQSKDKHLALLSEFFGDEAKAFAPLVGNMGLLDKALDSVSDKSKYAGSAFREFVERSKTTENVLTLLRNKFAEVGMSIGDRMLPGIKEAALGIGSVLDSMGERAHIFAQLDAGFQGFMSGLGAGGIRETIEDLGDLLFGKAEGGEAADKIGRIFVKFKEWGASIRELSAAIAENPLAKLFAQLAPYGLQIMLWGAGIALLAGTVRKLAAALMLLSGASTILAALNLIKQLVDLIRDTRPATPKTTPPRAPPRGGRPARSSPTSKAPETSKPPQPRWRFGVRGMVVNTIVQETGEYAIREGFKAVYGDKYREPPSLSESLSGTWAAWRDLIGGGGDKYAGEAEAVRQEQQRANVLGPATVRLDASSVAAMVQPSGTQDVRVVDRPQDKLAVMGDITINGVTDPQAAATAAANEFEARMRRIMEEYGSR